MKAAGLVETLEGKGPFTSSHQRTKLSPGTVDNLLKPESKATLTKILTYHVVEGNMDAATILAAIKAGKGTAELEPSLAASSPPCCRAVT